MKLGGIRKALLAAFPLVAMAVGYFGPNLTMEWWEGAIAIATPVAVWYFANDDSKTI